AAYGEASTRLVEALVGLGRLEEAYRVGEEGRRIVAEVLRKRPGYLAALRSHALLTGDIGDIEQGRLRLRRALELTREFLKDQHEFLKIDPANSVAMQNLAGGSGGVVGILYKTGRSAEALEA